MHSYVVETYIGYPRRQFLCLNYFLRAFAHICPCCRRGIPGSHTKEGLWKRRKNCGQVSCRGNCFYNVSTARVFTTFLHLRYTTKRNLFCHIFTLYNLHSKHVVCYVWHKAKRRFAANCFASCVSDYLENDCHRCENN